MNPQIIKGLNSLPLTFVGFFQKEPPYGWFLTYNDLTHDFRLYNGAKVIHMQQKMYFEFGSFPGQLTCSMIPSHWAVAVSPNSQSATDYKVIWLDQIISEIPSAPKLLICGLTLAADKNHPENFWKTLMPRSCPKPIKSKYKDVLRVSL